MIAHDAEDIPSAPVTQNVTLKPVSHPTLQLCIKQPRLGNQCESDPLLG